MCQHRWHQQVPTEDGSGSVASGDSLQKLVGWEASGKLPQKPAVAANLSGGGHMPPHAPSTSYLCWGRGEEKVKSL